MLESILQFLRLQETLVLNPLTEFDLRSPSGLSTLGFGNVLTMTLVLTSLKIRYIIYML